MTTPQDQRIINEALSRSVITYEHEIKASNALNGALILSFAGIAVLCNGDVPAGQLLIALALLFVTAGAYHIFKSITE